MFMFCKKLINILQYVSRYYYDTSNYFMKMDYAHLLYLFGNLFAIITSVYLGMTVYEAVDSAITVDATVHPIKHFRGDRRHELRNTLYSKIEFFMQDMYDEYMDEEEDEEEEEEDDFQNKNENVVIYSPFQVCYVNSYRVYDSNSTTFDYTKETEYNVEINDNLGLNQMYMVFDDIHMVFSVKHQQCILYPDVYRRDEF